MKFFEKIFIPLNLIDIDIRTVGSSKTDFKKIDSALLKKIHIQIISKKSRLFRKNPRISKVTGM